MTGIKLDGIHSNVSYLEDYSQLTRNTLVKGEYPKLYNEIALGSVAAKASGKKVGDTVTVEFNDVSKIYYVVGITQDIGNSGDYCSILYDAILYHNQDIKPDTIYIYLNETINVSIYMEKLKNLFGNNVLLANTEEQLNSILSSLGTPFLSISIIMIIITITIIGFVLLLLISTLIRNEKKEFGIMKAIGYKNKHLILQVIISMLPALILGMIAGIIFSFVLTNPLFSVALSSIGLLKTYFIIPVIPTIFIGLSIFGVSIVFIYLIASRIKKISPQKLIVEN